MFCAIINSMRELDYPFDSRILRRKKLSLKRKLLEQPGLMDKKIAILGGSTTAEIKDMMELFLLNQGIRPVFFESEYAQYWQDAVFGNEELSALKPDVIYIHTTNRNITEYPLLPDSEEEISEKLARQYEHFETMWEKLTEQFHCPIIQNNFEYPDHRLLGNRDGSDPHGRVNFIRRLNLSFAEYAAAHSGFYICDINYLSSSFGLDRWSDPSAWYLYKYALSTEAVPFLAFQTVNIIKALFGKNKKALALDLDNTLWGGIVGDDGVEHLELGKETPLGEAYTEFQTYLKELSGQGILLNVLSKNDPENAEAGMKHPGMILKRDDFISVKADWEPKSDNLIKMASELSLLPASFVFTDDNPAEREIVRQVSPGSGVPELSCAEQYIREIDHAGYFENTGLSKDDLKRGNMYRENAKRSSFQHSFTDYSRYLESLDMQARITAFEPVFMSRIAQLTNKSNQFNLTTRRYTLEEIEQASSDPEQITLSGSLQDRFGDNGVVSVVIGKIRGNELDIILWLMSCRVLKRGMEDAMMDTLVSEARKREITALNGFYYPTLKNKMVADFYLSQGFDMIKEDGEGNRSYRLDISENYVNRNKFIRINGNEE